MVGAGFKFLTRDVTKADSRNLSRTPARARPVSLRNRARCRGSRTLLLLSVLAPMSCLLAQCGSSPNSGATASNVQSGSGDNFNDRFPAQNERLAQRTSSGGESFVARKPPAPPPQRTAAAQPSSYMLAALPPQVANERVLREEQTALVSLQSSAFPYLGNNPRTDEPFLNVSEGGRRGHRGPRGRVFWQNETYNDNRTLVHIPRKFDVRKPGVIVVFFHGNGATLERDVRDRQLVPQQISESGANAVLLAPQLAVDAADSSAGKFWQPGAFAQFLAEAAQQLGKLHGDPRAWRSFVSMPVVIVAYSGGFVPAAYSLDVGGLGNRVRGVVLLDALYGELDKYASWIETNRTAFFVSAYTNGTKRHDDELMRMLRNKGITVAEDMDRPLKPGSVAFVATGDEARHRDYVTQAGNENPVKDVLAKMAETPALTRVAAGNPPR